MKLEWVDSIRQQCEEFDVAFFFKQWGGWGGRWSQESKKTDWSPVAWPDMGSNAISSFNVVSFGNGYTSLRLGKWSRSDSTA